MDLHALLYSGHSKEITMTIVDYITHNPAKLADLMSCFYNTDKKLCQRAAWPVGILGENHPEWFSPYNKAMIDNLKKPNHVGIIRNTIKVWQAMTISDEYSGEIYDLCFDFITDPKQPIAIRAFSMTVCANIARKNPELKDELILAITEQLEFGSPGIRSRGKSLIKSLSYTK